MKVPVTTDLFLFSTKATTSLTHPEITVTESIKQILSVPRENSATRPAVSISRRRF